MKKFNLVAGSFSRPHMLLQLLCAHVKRTEYWQRHHTCIAHSCACLRVGILQRTNTLLLLSVMHGDSAASHVDAVVANACGVAHGLGTFRRNINDSHTIQLLRLLWAPDTRLAFSLSYRRYWRLFCELHTPR